MMASSGKISVIVFLLLPVVCHAGSCSADDLSKINALPRDTSSSSFGAKSAACGKKAYSIFSGNFDHSKFNSCMSSSVGISTGCSECYAAAGEYGAKNCKAKCLTGWCKASCLQCTASAQEKAANCSGRPNPPLNPCLSADIEETGSCSADDLSKINALPRDTSSGSFGAKSAACGKKAYSIFSGNFDHAKFNSCMASSVGISTGCSECYAAAGEYGAKNCKTKCLTGWCKSGCLQCTVSAQKKAATCSGRPNPQVSPCLARNATEPETELVV